MNRFFLIRHGESEANAGFATTDPKDAALTPRGEMQAKQIAAFLKEYTSLNLIVTSRYLRTKLTAQPTREIFPFVHHEEWDVEEFTYLSPRSFGHSTVHERRPVVDVYWEMRQPSLVDGKGSESFRVFIGRVRNFIRLLQDMTTGSENIAVFTHELFISAVLWCLERESDDITPDTMREFRQFFIEHRISNGAIVELKFRRSSNTWNNELLTKHLKRAIPEPKPPPAPFDTQPVSLELVGQPR